ncbi:MAG: hypothetical protein CMA70_04530 [Euryarchaeota archaeon]|nr:hypothetical protein [Euryarchaeota archaeon]
MANDALKRFMVERLLDLDPTLSDDEGSDIFSKVVDPLLSRLGTDPKAVDIETFIVNRMSDEFPELDIASPGSVLRDVLISPLVLLLEPIRVEINSIRNQLSVADPTVLTTDELDALLSNVFSIRNIGDFSRGSVRVFFNAARSVSVDQSIVFSTAGGLSFVPEQVRTFLASELRRSGNLYYLDISVRSVEADAETNVDKNTIRFVNGLEGVVRVTNRAAFSGGVSEETGEEFLERAERSLSERSLNTKRGIETSILNSFSEITSLSVVGYGEPQMQRDILKGKATLSADEILGPITYTSQDFRGEPVFSHPDNQGLPKDVLIPFTNTIRLLNVPANKKSVIKGAKYMRVIGSGVQFDSFLLSRVREIKEVYDDNTDVLVVLKDFEVYPSASTSTVPKKSVPRSIFTYDNEHGFNRYARQGSSFSLLGTADLDNDANTPDVEVILGAPLPFTDYVEADALLEKPSEVLPGRDFLLVAHSDAASGTTYEGERTDVTNVYHVPAKLRAFPVNALLPDHKVRVDRVDAFLTSKDRINYQGEVAFTYSPDDALSGRTEAVTVVDFGGPAVSQALPADKYDGVTKDSWAKNAGVSLEARDPEFQTDLFDVAQTLDLTNLASEVKECDVVLNPNVPTWHARGVEEGHFISLSVFDGNFTGALSTVNTDIRWQAWGRIKKIDPHGDGDFRRARVEGLDWTNAYTHDLGNLQSNIPGVFGVESHTAPAGPITPLTTNSPTNTEYTFKLTYETPILLDMYLVGLISVSSLILSAPMSDGTTWQFRWEVNSDIRAYNSLGILQPGVVGRVNKYTGYLQLALGGLGVTVTDNSQWQIVTLLPWKDKYRAFWTVFKGERRMVASDGKLNISYDELVYPPAYKVAANATIRTQGAVAAPANLGYIGDNETASPTNTGFADIGDVAHNRPYASGYQAAVAWWLRLGKSLYTKHNSLGVAPAEVCTSAEFHKLYDASLNPDPSEGTLTAIQRDYPRGRFSQSPALFGDLAAQKNNFKTVVSSPFVPGSMTVSNATAVTTAITPTASVANQKGHTGFLIPYPFGPSFSQDSGLPYGDAAFVGDQTLLCFHNSVESIEESITGITVSDMPGSVPFPNFFSGSLEIKDDEVHIGGLTDIYVKPTSSEQQTTGSITLTPELLNNTLEVLLEAEDGSLSTLGTAEQASHFLSPDLSVYIASTYGTSLVSLDNLVVQLIEPSPALSPQFFRVLHTVSGGVKIDGAFSGVGSLTNVRFRVLKTCATSLAEPLVLLQQGTDLKSLANGLSVDLVGGVNFSQDVTERATFLHIDSGDNVGEYRLTSKSATSLGLQTTTPFSGEGLSYRVYIKQLAGVSLPLVRLGKVELSGDLEGISVPYKDPVDIIASSFTGINNDPITNTMVSSTGVLSAQGTGKAILTVAGVDLKAAGVLTYDVVRLDGLDDPLKYFYVTGFGTATVANDVLVLDRVLTLVTPLTDQPFTIGHPSVGTAQLVFMDKTFLEVGPEAEFSFTAETGKIVKFRSSPAESGSIFESSSDTTSVTVGTTTLVGDTLNSVNDENWAKYGIEAGDTVQILSKVISTGEFSPAESSALNLTGSTLVIKVANSVHNIVFTGTNPLSLSDIGSDINRQLSGQVSVTVEAGVLDPANFVLKFYSSKPVEILDTGSLGILTTLKISETSNTSVASLVGTFTVGSLTYDTTTSTSGIVLTTGAGAAGLGAAVFFKVTRPNRQRLYPADLTQGPDGFYRGSVKLTSFDPFEEETVQADQQLSLVGHSSLGYECVVENNSYSYSMGEEVSLKVTSVMLSDSASSFKEVYPLPGASVTITYDRSPEVESVQSFVLQPAVRVVCNNPLVRHYFPAYPVFSLDYTGFSPVSEIRAAIETFFSTLYPNRPLEVYDLTTILSKRRVTFVSYPVGVAFLAYDKDRNPTIIRSKNVVSLENNFHIMEDLTKVIINRVG